MPFCDMIMPFYDLIMPLCDTTGFHSYNYGTQRGKRDSCH